VAPVRTLTHRATGKTITLIGVIHGGHADYYQAIREIIDGMRARGAAIHGEGCMHRQPGPETAMTPDERAAVEAMGRNGKLGRRNAPHLADGWIHQLDGLPEGTWDIHDLTRQLGARLALHLMSVQNRSLDCDPTNPLTVIRLQRQFAATMRLAACWRLAPLRLLSTILGYPTSRLLHTERHRIALHAADQALTTNDHLTLVWGGRHQPAFVRALRRRGYRTSHLTWLTVGTLPGTSDPRPAPASAA
jgi:hypothetical protein